MKLCPWLSSSVILLTIATYQIEVGDWPQILGPSRNGIAVEEKLADSWPEDGPEEVWQREVGQGLAGVAVGEGKLLLYHRPQQDDVIEAMDVARGAGIQVLGFTPKEADQATTLAPAGG